jgi:hypothetical protein
MLNITIKATYDIIKTMAGKESLRYTMHTIMKRLIRLLTSILFLFVRWFRLQLRGRTRRPSLSDLVV